MSVRLLTEQHLEFLSLTGGCTNLPESIHVKMPHCWKSHVAAQFCIFQSELGHKSIAFCKFQGACLQFGSEYI